MSRYFALLFVLAPASIFAQALPALPQPAASATTAAPRTKADTVRAIQQLFRAKRITGCWLVGGSVAATAVTGIGTAVGGRGGEAYFNPTATESAVLLAVGTAPAWIPGSISLIRFSAHREQKVIARYSQQGRLPGYVQHRLRSKYFKLAPSAAR